MLAAAVCSLLCTERCPVVCDNGFVMPDCDLCLLQLSRVLCCGGTEKEGCVVDSLTCHCQRSRARARALSVCIPAASAAERVLSRRLAFCVSEQVLAQHERTA